MISSGRKVCRRSEAMERTSPSPPLNVGMITLTVTLLAGASGQDVCRTPNKASETSDKV
jgi:hypothetical protein